MLKQLDIFYHVTTPLSEPEINKEIVKAQSLQARVLEFFKRNPNKEMIWSDVAQGMGLEASQYGSVKRCISHLFKAGTIIRTSGLTPSVFGGMSHKYIYKG